MYNFIHKILFCALHCYTVPRPGGPCEDGLPGRPHYLPPGGPPDGLSGWYQQPGGPHDGLPGAQDDEIQTTNMDYSSLGNIQPDDQALNLDKENLPNDKPFDATSSLSSNMDYSDFLLLFMFLIALGRIFKRNTLLMFFWYISFVASIPIPDLSNDIPDSDSDLFFLDFHWCRQCDSCITCCCTCVEVFPERPRKGYCSLSGMFYYRSKGWILTIFGSF